jgi:hypothetical protein
MTGIDPRASGYVPERSRRQPMVDDDDSAEAGPDEPRVESRASGRPPEERDSDDPEDQARVILEESEERVMERERQSETGV